MTDEEVRDAVVEYLVEKLRKVDPAQTSTVRFYVDLIKEWMIPIVIIKTGAKS